MRQFNLDFQTVTTILDRLDPPQRARKFSNRVIFEKLCHVLCTGIPWRDLKFKGSYTTVIKRFHRWVKSDILQQLWVELMQMYSSKHIAEDPRWFEDLFIDSTMVKNVAGMDCLGKNPTDRGRLATKVSVICDKAGIPVSCLFIPANRNDATTTIETVDAIVCKVKKDNRYLTHIVGDKGYISHATMATLLERKYRLLTPARTNQRNRHRTPVQAKQLHNRHKIENVFARLDKFRRIHVRNDRLISSYSAMNYIAMSIMCLKAMELSKSPLRNPP
jgi:putative transposase